MSAIPLSGNGKLYSKLLLTITLCVVLTLLMSSIFYFVSYVRVDLKKAYESDLSNLTQTSKEIISMTDSAQSLSFQMYRNFTISKLMFYTEPSIYDITAAMSELDNYLSSMPFIESIYVYNSKNGQFYTASREGQGGMLSKEEIVDKGIIEVLDNFQQYRPFTPIPRTYRIVNLRGEQELKAYTFLCYDAIGRGKTINSAVIINISSDWINKDFGVAKTGKASQSYILDNQNRLLPGNSLVAKPLNERDTALLASKIRNRASGYEVANFEGQKSLISFTSPDSLDWQYVRITPYEEATKAVYSIRNTTIIIAAVILTLGLLISWLLSRMLYKPIHLIVDKMNKLESEKRNSSYTLRQNMLRGLIQGSMPLQTNGQLQRLVQSGIMFDFQSSFRVVLLKIDGFAALKETRGSDLLVYKFAIMNIGWEIGLKHYSVETVDMDDDSIVMLLQPLSKAEPAEELEKLRSVLEEIRQSTQQYLRIGLSVTYSAEATQPGQISKLYRSVREGSMHRFFFGTGCLIDAEEIASFRMKEYVFPADKERKLTDALMTARMEEAKRLFAEIAEETAGFPFHVVQSAISHLSMSINTVLMAIYRNNNLEPDSSNSVPGMDSFETIHEFKEAYYGLFNDIQAKLAVKRTMKHSELIRRVNELIHREYANPSFSLNWIADELGMSSIYLSRVYKGQTLTAIIDVINNVRLEYAKEFLASTDWSILDIATKCGYTSSSYFHRMFKKSFGVTPTDYRKLKLPPDAPATQTH